MPDEITESYHILQSHLQSQNHTQSRSEKQAFNIYLLVTIWALFGSWIPTMCNRTSYAQVQELLWTHHGDNRECTLDLLITHIFTLVVLVAIWALFVYLESHSSILFLEFIYKQMPTSIIDLIIVRSFSGCGFFGCEWLPISARYWNQIQLFRNCPYDFIGCGVKSLKYTEEDKHIQHNLYT